jgi:hypothetical protein
MSCGIDITGQGVLGLVAVLVQNPQVCPGGSVCLIQLYGTDVGLERIHRLVLLLVKYSTT